MLRKGCIRILKKSIEIDSSYFSAVRPRQASGGLRIERELFFFSLCSRSYRAGPRDRARDRARDGDLTAGGAHAGQ